MRKYIDQATKLYPDRSGMQQKILYLQTLFDAVRKEQSKILQWFQQETDGETEKIACNAESTFFRDVIQAEIQLLSKNNLYTFSRKSTNV